MDPKQAIIDLRDLMNDALAADHTPGKRLDIITAMVLQWSALDAWMSNGGFNPWEELHKGFEHAQD